MVSVVLMYMRMVCCGRVIAEGYRCIRVFSVMDSPVAKLVQEGAVLEFDATFQLDDRYLSVYLFYLQKYSRGFVCGLRASM